MASRADPTPVHPPQSAIWLLAFFVVLYVATAAAWLPILRSGNSLLAATGPLALVSLLITVMPSLVAIVLSA